MAAEGDRPGWLLLLGLADRWRATSWNGDRAAFSSDAGEHRFLTLAGGSILL